MRGRLTGFERLASWRRLIVVGALSVLFPSVSHAASATAPTIVVRVYDAFGTSPEELSRARLAFESAHDAADVNVRWRRCRWNGPDPCDDHLQPNELVIRLMRAPIVDIHVSPLALGYSSLQTSSQRGTLATIYPDRVRSLAQRAKWHAGDLLGNAIAHEVGHLLLGTNSHADEGLMRAHWTASDTRASDPADWRFLDHERSQIRDAVNGRAASPVAGVPTARLDLAGRETFAGN